MILYNSTRYEFMVRLGAAPPLTNYHYMAVLHKCSRLSLQTEESIGVKRETVTFDSLYFVFVFIVCQLPRPYLKMPFRRLTSSSAAQGQLKSVGFKWIADGILNRRTKQ